MYLFKFLEKINTECNTINSIPLKALRMDKSKNRRGISDYLKLNLSSCDYLNIKHKNNKKLIIFIEISDIKKQIENLENKRKLKITDVNMEDIEKIEDRNCKEVIEKNLKNLKRKEIKKIILNELRKKVLESIIIFCKLKNNFKIKEKNLKDVDFMFCLILCNNLKDSQLPIIEELKGDLNNIMSNVISSVKIIPLTNEQEIKEYIKKCYT